MLGIVTLSLTSCGDPADEITSLVFGRNFSPTDFEASGVTEESATVKWTAVSGATSYTMEVFADDSLSFEGTPVQTINGITDTQYKLSGLVYDTDYSVRILALTEGDESRTSKWNGVYFKTAAQQIFETPSENDIADKSVIMTWPEGEAVTKIVASDADGKIVTTKELTAEEIAAGSAEVTGLTPETAYTINLYNGEKERGNKKVTTIADLNGAIVVRPNDDLGSLIENAEDGAVLALFGGTHVIKSDDAENPDKAGAAKVSKSITIKGIYPTNVPIIQGRFEIEDGASLSLNQIILDGENNATEDQAFNFKTASATYGALDVQNTEIKNFTKGAFYFNVAATIESITFNNCLIHDIECNGGDLFDARKGLIKALTFSNSTIYDCAQERDFIRMDKNSNKYTETSKISLNNCTINNVCNKTANKRFFYVRFNPAEITMSNCIVTNTLAVFSNQSSTPVPTFTNNCYYNVTNLLKLDKEGKTNFFIDETATTADPQYEDTDNGDFTIKNESVSKLKAGDPRWY